MALIDTPWCGKEANKLYLQSGQFTSTLKTSEDVSVIDSFTEGITYDLTNTPWTGHQGDKFYLQSGQFTSTLKTSEPSVIDTEPNGISWDGTNTPWSGDIGDKLYLQSGQFTSTLKTSQLVNPPDSSPKGISWDGTNTPWIGLAGDKLYLQSGQFTSTLKTSEGIGAIEADPKGISWDGINTPWTGSIGIKLYLQSGQFTSTLKTSEDVSVIDSSPEDICTNNVNNRIGSDNNSGDAAVTLPQLTVQGLGAATGDITLPQLTVAGASLGLIGTVTLPLLSIVALGPATGSMILPQLTVQVVSGATGIITLPLLSVQGTRGFHGIVDITLPIITTEFSGLTGSIDGTTINLPTFIVSITTGLINAILLPQLTLGAEGFSGIKATYAKSLPRMIVNIKATVQSRGTFDISLPAFTLDNELFTGEISLASTRDLPMFRITATGFRGENGDGAVTFPAFSLSTESYQSLSGTVVQSLKMLTLDAYADSYTNRII